MAASSSTQSLLAQRIETTPGAFPPDHSQGDSPVVVSSHLSLSQAVHARRAEFTRKNKIRVKVGTWNIASCEGTEKDIGDWFVQGQGISGSLSGLAIKEEKEGTNNGVRIEDIGAQEQRRSKKKSTLPENDPGSLPGSNDIGIYALGLQEIVNITSATEALRPYSDPHPARKWKQAIEDALPSGYIKVAEQQLIGLFLVIYASPTVAPTISSVSTTSVGTGVLGYMGNKGAVTARIILGETTRIVFVNCHLTAGVEKGSLERRNWDASQIISRTKFDPVFDGGGVMEEFGEGIGDEDFAFWFGDLNYRLEDIPGEDVRRLLMLHTRNEYGSSVASKKKIDHELANPTPTTFTRSQDAASQTFNNGDSSAKTTADSFSLPSIASSITLPEADIPDPSADPTSLQTALSSLLSHDQLHSQMRTRKAFHDGWKEGPIEFLPTYKYDVGSVDMFDSSEKRRGPSWCDRILYRTRKDKQDYEDMVKNEEMIKKKDDEMKLSGVVEAATDEAVLFDYNPDEDGTNDEHDEEKLDTEVVVTKAGFEDRLLLEQYISHQRVLSSDHKPLDAVFTLDYDAVDPELRAKVHQDVARELDKEENEGRPNVTVVVDHYRDSETTNTEPNSSRFEGVDFGHVKYDHLKTRNVTVANTGRVPATVGFIDRSIDTGHAAGIAPPWLRIRFDRFSDEQITTSISRQEYTLQPGDAINVELIVHVTDMDLVRRLSEGIENLEDVLVLHVHNGRDYFLPLRGEWLQSAFGRSIEKLVRIPEGGVRRLQQQRPGGSSHSDHEGVKWSAPRELLRLTEGLEELVERTIAEWEMRGEEEGQSPWEENTGWPFEGRVTQEKERSSLREGIREALDRDQPFVEFIPPETGSLQKLEAIAETLMLLLKSLEGGIITEAIWMEVEKGMLDRERAKVTLSDEDERLSILDILSSVPTHSVSFTLITFMLSRVVNEIAPLPPVQKLTTPASSFEQMEAVRQSFDDPLRLRRDQIDEAYASIFSTTMIRLPMTLNGKTRRVSETRAKHVIKIFLKT